MGDTGKAAKAHVYGTPLIALMVAITGYISNKSDTDAAKRKADREGEQAVEMAVVESDERLRRAYDELAIFVETELNRDAQRLDDLEAWVAELEEFIESELETDTPRTRRERQMRDARLAEIRAKKAERKSKTKADRPASLPAYDVVQEAR